MSDAGDHKSESEYEEVDYSDHPMYVILSTMLQDDSGDNICDHLKKLTAAVEANTAMMAALLKNKTDVNT